MHAHLAACTRLVKTTAFNVNALVETGLAGHRGGSVRLNSYGSVCTVRVEVERRLRSARTSGVSNRFSTGAFFAASVSVMRLIRNTKFSASPGSNGQTTLYDIASPYAAPRLFRFPLMPCHLSFAGPDRNGRPGLRAKRKTRNVSTKHLETTHCAARMRLWKLERIGQSLCNAGDLRGRI